MTRLIYILIAPLLLKGFLLFGQAQTKDLTEMEYLFSTNKYAAAWSVCQQLLQNDSLNTNLNYKMGVCYLNSRSQKEKAIQYFKKVISIEDKSLVPDPRAHKLLADAYFMTSDFDQAISNYEIYREKLQTLKGSTLSQLEEINKQIEMCQMGKELKVLKELVATLINQRFSGADTLQQARYRYYSSTSSADESTLLFNFRKPAKNWKPLFANELFEDNYISMRSTPTYVQENSDTSNLTREATVATSVDGQIILTYRDDKGDGNLYESALHGNEWTIPEKLSKNINTHGWEPNEYISADGNTLYFTSTRKDGFGGKDIYKSIKLLNGEWSAAINMGYPINSVNDDEAPFVHPDGVTLYFSSNRAQNKNRYDIYTFNLSDTEKVKTPFNVGYPLNKESVAREAKTHEIQMDNDNKYKEKDNYLATFINHKNIPLTLFKGKIVAKDKKETPNVEITVTDNETGEISGVYTSEYKTGRYVFILPPGKNCAIRYESKGYLIHSENIDISKEVNSYKLRRTIELCAIAEDSKEFLNNIFFKQDQISLHPSSYPELNRLADFLNSNPKLIIEFSVPAAINVKETAETGFGKSRILAVKNYLIEKGIHKERIHDKVERKSKKRKKRITKTQSTDQLDKIEMKIIKII